jgi:RNA recognition motif-containing protein
MKLYVGNLPYSYKEQDLKQLFAKFTSIISTVLVKDRDTGNFRGFAFVEFSSDDEAREAMNELNGSDVDGKAIIVNEALQKTDRPSRPPFRNKSSFGGERSFGNKDRAPRKNY